MGTVLAASARIVVAYCESVGVDVRAALRHAAISDAALSDPDGRLPAEAVAALWREIYRITQDAALGLHVAESSRPGSFRVTHFIAANSPTVGAAFERLCAFSRWADDSVALKVVAADERFAVVLDASNTEPCGGLVRAEHTLALLYLGVSRATRVSFAPVRLDLVAPCPADPGERERVFRCRARFAQPENRLWFDRRTWNLEVQGANDALLDVLEAHARTLLANLPAEPTVVSSVRQIVCRQLSHGAPAVEHVARELGVSVRALQRALAEHATSFSQVVDDTRIATAQALLADRSLSIAEIALMLGFAEQSAFSRAYKRWTGTPPIRARARPAGNRMRRKPGLLRAKRA